MLLSRANLTAHLSAKDAIRFQLHSILLAPEGTISTDGKAMLCVPYPDEADNEFPMIDGLEDYIEGSDRDAPFGALVPLPACLAAAKTLPRSALSRRRPILECCRVVGDGNGNQKVTLATTDLEVSNPAVCRTVEGNFPPHDKVFPEGERVGTISLSVLQLDRILKAAKAAGASLKEGTIQFDIRDSKSAVVFKIARDRGPALATGLVMPMAGSDDPEPVKWPAAKGGE